MKDQHLLYLYGETNSISKLTNEIEESKKRMAEEVRKFNERGSDSLELKTFELKYLQLDPPFLKVKVNSNL